MEMAAADAGGDMRVMLVNNGFGQRPPPAQPDNSHVNSTGQLLY
jgi:hypothetical protein